MKRGAVEINTKRNNWYLQRPLQAAEAGGGVSIELYRQIYAQLLSAEGQMVSKALDPMEFRQSLDLTQTYVNRSLPIVSTFLTAAILNSGNRFLISVAAPLWETDEMNFHSTRKEWNQIEYDDVAEGGIAGETSFSKWGWTDKLKQKKQSATVTMDLALDDTFGKAEWDENLSQLAADALLTLYKEVAYALLTIGYGNMVEDRSKNIPFDLSLLYRAEAEAMMIFALDQNRGFDMIRAMQERIPGLNLCIFPRNSMRFLREIKGESRKMDGQLITTNQQTNTIEARIVEGPDSFMSVKLGQQYIDFMEMPGFRVHSRDESTEDPLTAKITLAQYFAANPNVSFDEEVIRASSEHLAVRVFHQTKEIGQYYWVQFADQLRNCFMWDRETGQVSIYVHRLANKLNTGEAGGKPHVPAWAERGRSLDDQTSEDHSYGRPNAKALVDQDDLLKMKTFRHEFCGLTYDKTARRWRVPNTMGDYDPQALPNEAIGLASRHVALRCQQETGVNLRLLVSDTMALVNDINNAEATDSYVTQLIAANQGLEVGSDGVTQLRTNEVGGLVLPRPTDGTLLNMLYPPGFASGPGLVTLAREANSPAAPFRVAGERAASIVARWDLVGQFVERIVPGTEAADGANAGVSNNSTVAAALIDTLIGRGTPIFVNQRGADDPDLGNGLAALVLELTRNSFAQLKKGITARTNGVTSTVLRALCTLNERAFNASKAVFIAAQNEPTTENARVVTALAERILAIIPFGTPPNKLVAVVSEMATQFIAELGTSAAAASDFVRRMGDKKEVEKISPKQAKAEDTANLVSQLQIAEGPSGPAERSNFVRTSLVGSARLREFIRNAASNRGRMALGNHATMFRTHLEPGAHATDLPTSSLLRLAGAFRVSGQPTPRTPTPTQAQRTPKSKTLGALFTEAQMDPSGFARQEPDDPEDGPVASGAPLRQRYFGPWGSRLLYASRLRSEVEQLFFLIVAQAPNTLPVQLGLAECGAKLINVVMFRPFMEFTAKSVVCMQAGENTLLTVMSRFKVLVSKEDRGIFHVTANFYCGTVRTGPENIRLLPYCLPDRWLGGKNVDFMTDPSQWTLPNPIKPSIIALPVSVAEGVNGSTYGPRMHMVNQRTYRRPGYDISEHDNKYSGWRLYEVVFGPQTGYVDGMHRDERSKYWGSVDVSHVAHRAPCAYINQRTGLLEEQRGVGPGQDERMNTPGAEKTWNGDSHYFPDLPKDTYVRQRT